MWLCTLLVHTPHTIQVWGIASFILVRSFHNLQINRRGINSTLFFIITAIGVVTVISLRSKITKLYHYEEAINPICH